MDFISHLLRGNAVGDATQVGIIRKAALYAGFGPATGEMFQELWRRQAKEEANKGKGCNTLPYVTGTGKRML